MTTAPIFTYLEYNEETNCLEGYLEGESSPRTDIPADNRTILSLIALLANYTENSDE